MRWIILFETVMTLRLERKITVVTCCHDFFQVFVLKECISSTRWNRAGAGVGVNTFPWLWYMFIHFYASEDSSHSGEIDRPAIRWILQLWFTGNTRIGVFARRFVVLFPFRVNPVRIWIDNVLITARLYITFNPLLKKKGIVLIPNNFCIEFKPDGFGFQTLLTNLRDISTRADVLRFSKSQVLFQPGKHREYRLLTKHMQPHVMIKTCWESHRGGVTNLAFTLPVLGHPKVRHICIRCMIKLRKRFFFYS